jgi:hypothetical protein
MFTLNAGGKRKNKENLNIQEFDYVTDDYRMSVQASDPVSCF